MKLVFPNMSYKNKAISYINEFYKYNSNINGSGALDRFLKEDSYEAWLEFLIKDMDYANIKRDKSPALTYFYVDDNDEIIGMVNIRLIHTNFIINECGNIGYSIRPTKRRLNHATNMLKLALDVLKKNGMKDVYISCDKENLASKGVILKCGGILHHEIYSNRYNELIEMYVIKQ